MNLKELQKKVREAAGLKCREEGDFLIFYRDNTSYTVSVRKEDYERWENGEKSQDVWPELSADAREFLQSGMTPDEFEEMCRKLEEEEKRVERSPPEFEREYDPWKTTLDDEGAF